MKKVLSALIVAVMLIGMLPAIAIPAFAEVTSGTTGDCAWTLNGTELTISGNGAMGDYYSYGVLPWGKSITKVIIKEGITNIGNYAFYDCDSLISITIPDSVASIGDNAFYCCTSLTNIIIPDSVTIIGDSAFYRCTSLTNIIIPDSVTIIGDSAFGYCYDLASVKIGNGVTRIGSSAFIRTAVYSNESNWDDGGLYIDQCLIYGESGLYGSYEIKSNTRLIADSAFYNRIHLTSIMIPDSVSVIGIDAFRDCDGLEKVYISDLAAWCAIDFGGAKANPMFYAEELYINNTLVTDLVIPKGVTAIGDWAFWYYSGLTSVTIPDSVTTIGALAFQNCVSLTSVTIGNSVTTIGYNAFSRCPDLTSVNIPDSVTHIDDYAFNECTGLKTVRYAGTPQSRSFISVGVSNGPLNSANWIYSGLGNNPFKDVKVNEYYTEPVLWAVGKNITNGMTANTFAPNNDCTRGQIVTFLWRAAGSPEPKSTRNPFKDVKSNQYYYKAVLWAVEKGITNGTSTTTFSPDATCTRAQVVTFLWRAKGSPKVSASNPFKDVKKSYYSDAVLWAVKNNITTGISATQFAPDNTCTRGQIVTFLYRAYN